MIIRIEIDESKFSWLALMARERNIAGPEGTAICQLVSNILSEQAEAYRQRHGIISSNRPALVNDILKAKGRGRHG